MKQTRRMFSWLVAGSLALLMVTSLTAQTAKESPYRVVRVKGVARYSTGNNVWQPVKVGTLFKSGYLIQTAANSYVDLGVGEPDAVVPRATAAGGDGGGYKPRAAQDMIRVKEDTVLSFDKLTVTDTGAGLVTETQLDLRSGKIFGTVKKLTPTSHYEIKLPNGVAGVRGTVFMISADGVVQCLSGSVVISWSAPDGTPMTQSVIEKQQFDTRTGLITPIPDYQSQELLGFRQASLMAGYPQPYSFVGDQTLYYVSPTQGANGPETDGGGGGQ